MPVIQWNCTRAESRLARRIVERAVKAHPDCFDSEQTPLSLQMDLEACHCNGCPLDFSKLVSAPEGDFGHDVFGIRRFIDRFTGEISPLFHPRCARPS